MEEAGEIFNVEAWTPVIPCFFNFMCTMIKRVLLRLESVSNSWRSQLHDVHMAVAIVIHCSPPLAGIKLLLFLEAKESCTGTMLTWNTLNSFALEKGGTSGWISLLQVLCRHRTAWQCSQPLFTYLTAAYFICILQFEKK